MVKEDDKTYEVKINLHSFNTIVEATTEEEAIDKAIGKLHQQDISEQTEDFEIKEIRL